MATGEEDFQQAHVCDVTSNRENVAPGGLKRLRTWCKHTLSMTARQKNAFLSGSPKQDVARGLLTMTPSQEAANYHIKPWNGWAPAQQGRLDTCWSRLPGTHSLPVSQGLRPELTPWSMSSMTHKLLWHPCQHMVNRDPDAGCPSNTDGR